MRILFFCCLLSNLSYGQWIEREDGYWDVGCNPGFSNSFQMFNDSTGCRIHGESPTPSNRRIRYAEICNYGLSPIPPPVATFEPSWVCDWSSTTPWIQSQYESGPTRLQFFNFDSLLYIEDVTVLSSTLYRSYDALNTLDTLLSIGPNHNINDYYFLDVSNGFMNISNSSTDLLIEYNEGVLDTIYIAANQRSTKIHFYLNGSIGFMVSEDLTLYKKQLMRTHDLGQTWIPVLDFPTSYKRSINFVSDSVGFMVLQNDSIFKTTDQGNSWSAVSIDYNRFQGVYDFVTENLWYAVQTPDSLFKTYDHGQTWVYDSLTINNITDIAIRSDSLGYAIGYSCKLYTKNNIHNNVGVNDLQKKSNNLSIYPNPVNNTLYIIDSNDRTKLEINEIKIIDYMGRVLKSHKLINSSVHVADLNSGIYIIKLITNDKITTKKFIKQ